ncbi:MAG: hypothetical protein JWN78_501 [Bacteroidota bacterium]|nr:hypothetical protein [Bacteroidota bacterium]
MQKIKSIAVVIMVMIATVTMFTACRHHCKKDGKCCKEMCAKDSSCCKHKGNKECCKGDKKDCEKGEKKACCAKGGAMEGRGMYHCPMDSGVMSDKPGKCPKCGMELEKTK